jgi:Na+/proline symporter
MKAVVWTDAFQSLVMLIAMIWIMVKGVIDSGGIAAVWKDNMETDRIEFFK